jgi:hypothetical protein
VTSTVAGVEDGRAEKQRLDDRRHRGAGLLSVVLCRPMAIVGWAVNEWAEKALRAVLWLKGGVGVVCGLWYRRCRSGNHGLKVFIVLLDRRLRAAV